MLGLPRFRNPREGVSPGNICTWLVRDVNDANGVFFIAAEPGVGTLAEGVRFLEDI